MLRHGRDNIEGKKEENCHGGKGVYTVRTHFEKEFDSNISYIREIILKAGSSVGIHKHEGDKEIYYFVSGKGVMTVDGEEQEVKPGDVVLTKSGSSHGLENSNEEDMIFFVICAKV